MTTISTPDQTAVTGRRRISAATLLLAAVAIAASALGPAATANTEWDIGAFDACMAKTIRFEVDCCDQSGGIYDFVNDKCTAPIVVEQQFPAHPQRPVNPVPPVHKQAPPPPVTPTAPVNRGTLG